MNIEISFLQEYPDLAANPSEYLPLFQCELLWFYPGVSHTKLAWKAFPSHSVGHGREASLCHYLFTDNNEECKSPEGSGELACAVRGIDEDQSTSGR